VDFSKLEQRLKEFLELVEAQPTDNATVAAHLRYPSASGTLAGSTLGRQLWDSPEGSALISCLLEDERLKEWFAPPPETRLNEVRFRIASLVGRRQAKGTSPDDLAVLARELAEALLEPNIVATAVQVFFGLTADSSIALPYEFHVAPATQDELRTMLSMVGGREVDVLRIPARPAIAVMTSIAIPRQQWGAMAGVTAIVLPWAMFEGVRFVLWLASGVYCAKGDYYVNEESQFPLAELERQTASVAEMFPGSLASRTAAIEPPLLRDLMIRHEGAVKGIANVSLPDDVVIPLWTASTFLDAGLRSLDTLFILFLCYSALEGMLLLEGDDDSRLGPRIGRLVGKDVQDRRDIRRILRIWRELRGSAAHGRRAQLSDLVRFIGREPNLAGDLGGMSMFDTREWEEAARVRAFELARRTYLGMLFSLIHVNDETITEGMTRTSLVKLLDQAERNDASAVIAVDEMIPAWIKDVVI